MKLVLIFVSSFLFGVELFAQGEFATGMSSNDIILSGFHTRDNDPSNFMTNYRTARGMNAFFNLGEEFQPLLDRRVIVNSSNPLQLQSFGQGRAVRPFQIDYGGFTQGNSLYGMSSSLTFENCPYNLVFPDMSNIEELTRSWTGGGECFNQVTPRAYASARIQNDINACNCLREQRNNLVAYAMDNGMTGELNVAGLSQNIQFSMRRMETFRSGLLLQTSLLTNSDEEARRITPSFNNMSSDMSTVLTNYATAARREITGQITNHENTLDSESRTQIQEEARRLEAPNSSEVLLTAGQPDSCLTVKEFLAYRQTPEIPQFYDGLRTEEWDAANWNLDLLKNDLNRVLASGGTRDPQYQKLRARIQFLERNGLWRAVFSASDETPGVTARKQELFQLINNTFGRSRNPQEFLNTNYQRYREESRRFLGNPDVTEIINSSEVARARREFSPEEGRRISTMRPLPSTTEAYRNWTANFHPQLSGCDRPENASRCLISYAVYCPQVTQVQEQLRNLTLPISDTDHELEELSNTELDPTRNIAYQEFRQQMCGPRSGPDGTVASFENFKSTYCRGRTASRPECANTDQGRKALLSRYVTTYPETSFVQDASMRTVAFAAFLQSVPAGGNLSEREARVASQESIPLSEVKTRTQERMASLGRRSDFTHASRNMPKTSVAATPASSGSSASSSQSAPSSGNTPQQQSPQGQVLAESPVFQPTVTQPSPEAQALRSQRDSNASEMASLREELVSLGDELQTEMGRESGQRNSDAIDALNRRFEDVNRQLQASIQRERDLNSQIAALSDERGAPVRRRPAADNEILPRALSSVSPGVVVPFQAPAAISVPSPNGNIAGAGPSAGPVIPLLPSNGGRTVPANSVNNALLASNRESVSNESAGAGIVVSNASTSEYMQLLARTSGNMVSEPIPGDVFERFKSGDFTQIREQFGDRLPDSGQVGLFQLTNSGTNETLDILIENTGDQLTVTGRSIASRPAQAVQRSATLDDLNNTVRTPGD